MKVRKMTLEKFAELKKSFEIIDPNDTLSTLRTDELTYGIYRNTEKKVYTKLVNIFDTSGEWLFDYGLMVFIRNDYTIRIYLDYYNRIESLHLWIDKSYQLFLSLLVCFSYILQIIYSILISIVYIPIILYYFLNVLSVYDYQTLII